MRPFTAQGLDRLHRVLESHVERGIVPGLVALVARHGEVHVATLGALAVDDPRPMRRDAVFRITSLSKPVTAVAAMILIEDCALRLDDSIERWIPELADRRVLRTIGSELDDTAPARRPITVRDLLTYTMGFGSVIAMPGTHPIQARIRADAIGGDAPPFPSKTPDQDEWVRRLGRLPLLAQPGERWMYDTSGDVLGVLISRVSGQSFEAFLRQRIFDPLDIKDTSFRVSDEAATRMPTAYGFDHVRNELAVYDDVQHSAWRDVKFESGSGGLISTIDDYFAFCRMLLEKGQTILSRAAVELMTADHLTPGNRIGAELFFGDYGSWGLGLGVNVKRTEVFYNPGRFGWDGGLGTSAHTDPKEGLIGLLFTQRRLDDSPEPLQLYKDFWTAAYGAMS
jgi:CubicO group peptidase (beta-lactamase class C family)